MKVPVRRDLYVNTVTSITFNLRTGYFPHLQFLPCTTFFFSPRRTIQFLVPTHFVILYKRKHLPQKVQTLDDLLTRTEAEDSKGTSVAYKSKILALHGNCILQFYSRWQLIDQINANNKLNFLQNLPSSELIPKPRASYVDKVGLSSASPIVLSPLST